MGRRIGWGEEMVGEKDRLGRFKVGWVGKKDFFGRRMGHRKNNGLGYRKKDWLGIKMGLGVMLNEIN